VLSVIKFSRNYRKLRGGLFTTIRRYDKYKVGELYTVRVENPRYEFTAMLIAKFKVRLEDLPREFLLYDTDIEDKDDAIEYIKGFYRRPVDKDEKFTVLLFDKDWDIRYVPKLFRKNG